MRILSAPAPGPTVGEVNAKSLVPRAAMWVVAAFLPCFSICGAAAICYCLSYDEYVFSESVRNSVRSDPWRLAAVMMWGIYMAVLSAVMMYMHLFLPSAPFAVRKALVDVGATWIGLPLSWVAPLVACFGYNWMAVALVCVFLALIAALLALGAWLSRTYNN
ncbi:hypothetical protein SETIT_7G147100v2 [Setaria italica]|uniref:DUF7378 domain-containing protein n=1 Tax=Setaria italica TaxID=4555 RepID=K3YDY4_SETIT|nr:hypothetical protein SETIT_7G147100v2 [Setaria italica]